MPDAGCQMPVAGGRWPVVVLTGRAGIAVRRGWSSL